MQKKRRARLTRQRRSAGNQLEIPMSESQERKPARGIDRRTKNARPRDRTQQVEEGEAEGKRSRRKEIAGESYPEKRREKCERATTLPAARVHSMSVLSLASGLESRGEADRSSIGAEYLSLPCNPLSRGVQSRISVVRRCAFC